MAPETIARKRLSPEWYRIPRNDFRPGNDRPETIIARVVQNNPKPFSPRKRLQLIFPPGPSPKLGQIPERNALARVCCGHRRCYVGGRNVLHGTHERKAEQERAVRACLC